MAHVQPCCPFYLALASACDSLSSPVLCLISFFGYILTVIFELLLPCPLFYFFLHLIVLEMRNLNALKGV